ncbi:Na(+)/H(+) antiporter subunit D1 [Jeotgalicoccus aerolatus]|uniref:Multicomponent Na+:H+ antiporter subunit D n=1 Tax=Jeotgalicoccus aerolatus TaxID=709510 RepID=A0A1G8ZSI2_9STAP|nr:Na+/H+ antiporter subunit D [Jeotgalicoccus aerolatus]MBP1951230.1 multicomponent Na+:H+ antiporter subunit D [Jeotgalicoccus aerolatus]NMA81231.1 Na+/H+ antiporter subunit D [Jeotgalicoccus aerolatus]CAD2077540.1 Na(+)/H(+) antiporter subunit D1 [Jeotgalicoccus aerolatus]SDK18076.1 multicomponent Na+:H+ antiporter subunit D [Jeotgalicoccus aerolatus]GGD99198.1 Na(+)/H(+) antiporter subunit D1 [Jeotgalicoccus aerolatus]
MTTNILPMLPIILPFLAGVIMLFLGKRPMPHRMISAVTSLIMVGVAAFNVYYVYVNGTMVTFIGNWSAPFGISVVYDMVAALLVLTTSIVTFFVVVYSFQSIGYERERYYYYPMVLFMITGIIGAFTTGDIFNMFVFFEVFLLASYVLITLGSRKIQLQEGFKYLVVNIVSSNFFLVGLAYLYSVTGSLNMADIHIKLSNYDGNLAIMTIVAVVFLFVFATKAGLFPLYFWMPGSYNAPPMPVIALFGALLTKVGVYAIARTYSLFFTNDVGYTHQVLLLLSLLTIIVGSIGALAYTNMKQIIIYNIMIAVGVIMVGFSMMDYAGTVGSMYYLIHDMIIKAALFLLIGFIIYRTGKNDAADLGGLIRQHPVVGWTFFIATLSLAGVPPFPGFFGKLYIVESAFDNGHAIAAILVLLSSLVVLYSVIRIFIKVFWGEPAQPIELKNIKSDKLLFSAVGLVIISAVFGLSADFLFPIFEMAAESFFDPSSYSNYLMGVE